MNPGQLWRVVKAANPLAVELVALWLLLAVSVAMPWLTWTG